MKNFTVFMSTFLSILLFSSTISSTMVFANNDQSIDELVHGEEVNWDNIEWEEIDIECNNDEEEFHNEEYEEIDLNEGEDYQTDYDFIIINEEDPRFREAEIQPILWGLIARVVLTGGKHVVKFGSKVFKKQPASKAVNHTKNFKTANVCVLQGKSTEECKRKYISLPAFK